VIWSSITRITPILYFSDEAITAGWPRTDRPVRCAHRVMVPDREQCRHVDEVLLPWTGDSKTGAPEDPSASAAPGPARSATVRSAVLAATRWVRIFGA
jgi:hypothetical protein